MLVHCHSTSFGCSSAYYRTLRHLRVLIACFLTAQPRIIAWSFTTPFSARNAFLPWNSGIELSGVADTTPLCSFSCGGFSVGCKGADNGVCRFILSNRNIHVCRLSFYKIRIKKLKNIAMYLIQNELRIENLMEYLF